MYPIITSVWGLSFRTVDSILWGVGTISQTHMFPVALFDLGFLSGTGQLLRSGCVLMEHSWPSMFTCVCDAKPWSSSQTYKTFWGQTLGFLFSGEKAERFNLPLKLSVSHCRLLVTSGASSFSSWFHPVSALCSISYTILQKIRKIQSRGLPSCIFWR